MIRRIAIGTAAALIIVVLPITALAVAGSYSDPAAVPDEAAGEQQQETVATAEAPAGAGVEVTVADDGDGISSEELPHVLDRFYRGTTSARAGSGIALAIARSIVDAHGGTLVGASDDPGTGATLTITLPQSRTLGSRYRIRGCQPTVWSTVHSLGCWPHIRGREPWVRVRGWDGIIES